MKPYPIVTHLSALILLVLVLLVAGWIRIRGVPDIPEGQFSSTDAYRYAREVELITEQGRLPKRDMHRWVPLGRDTTQSLNLYPYLLAYLHKPIALFAGTVTRYHVQLFAPVICFLLGIGVLYFFLYRVFGLSVAASVGLLLAVMPGSVERSMAGFSDRDSWCWLLGTLTVTVYLWKEHAHRTSYRFGGAMLSGFFMFLGALSWEGFGVFGIVILTVELWRFLTTETEEHLTEYLLWLLMFVPGLYLISPAYRRGEGFTTHLALLVLLLPLVVLAIRMLRYCLITYPPISQFIRRHVSPRTVALVLCTACLMLGMSYTFSQQASFAESTVPFSNNRLMQTVDELRSAADDYWYFRYGGVFLLGSLGLIGGCIRMWGKKGIFLATMLCLITLSTFFRVSLAHLLVPLLRLFPEHAEEAVRLSGRLSFTICAYVFHITAALAGVAALGIACLRKVRVKNELVYIAMAVWFLLWVGLTRDAKRYDFFVGVPFAFFTTILIHSVSSFLSEKYKRRTWLQSMLKAGISAAMLALLLFWEPLGNPEADFLAKRGELTPTELRGTLPGQRIPEGIATEADFLAKRGVLTPTELRGAIPGRNTPQGIALENALNWMKTEYSEKKDTVVCTEWSYGSILNMLGGVKTVIDQDHYIQHWIYLYSRYVFCAQSEQEALGFLNAHQATHLLLTEAEVLYPQTSFVGSNEEGDRQFKMIRLRASTPEDNSPKYEMMPAWGNPSIKSIDIDFAEPVTVTAELKTGEDVLLPYVAVSEEGLEKNLCTEDANGGILHYFDEDKRSAILYYIPPIGWNSLAVKLFLRGLESSHFVPVYPEEFSTAKVKMWEIHYPADIHPNLKYLATDPGE